MYSTLIALIRQCRIAAALLLLTFQAAGQIVQPDRIEIPLTKSDVGYEVAPMAENGMFLYRNLLLNNTRLIELVKLDTSFTQQWQGYLKHDNEFELIGKRHAKGKLHLLLRHIDIRRKGMLIFRVNEADGTYHQHVVKNFIAFVPTEFQVSETAAIIGGYYNNVPVVLYYNFDTQQSRILPGLLNEAGELTQIEVHDDGGFNVLISAFIPTGNRTIWIKQYDPEGNLLFQMPLKTEGNKHLLFGRSVYTGNASQLIAGTYGNRRSEYSKGLFLASIDPSGYQQIRYYNYGDLHNFFKFMKVKREQRIKDRIERRKEKGKNVRFNYRFIVHEVVPYKDQFVLLGEAFYPKYITVDNRYSSSFFYYGAMPAMVSNRGRVFDGFRYTHAVVMGFDAQGHHLWDNTFEINDVKTFTLEQFVRLEMQPDKIALLYLFENQIRSKIIEGNNVVEGKTIEPIRPLDGETVVRNRASASKSRLNYWYKDNFYAYGIQQIAKGSEGEQTVFYVNKVSFANEPTDN